MHRARIFGYSAGDTSSRERRPRGPIKQTSSTYGRGRGRGRGSQNEPDGAYGMTKESDFLAALGHGHNGEALDAPEIDGQGAVLSLNEVGPWSKI